MNVDFFVSKCMIVWGLFLLQRNLLGHRCENEPWSCMEEFCMLVAATIA